MKKWDNLSLQEKSKLMGIYVHNGVKTLLDIKQHYNKFADGGDKDDSSIQSIEIPTVIVTPQNNGTHGEVPFTTDYSSIIAPQPKTKFTISELAQLASSNPREYREIMQKQPRDIQSKVIEDAARNRYDYKKLALAMNAVPTAAGALALPALAGSTTTASTVLPPLIKTTASTFKSGMANMAAEMAKFTIASEASRGAYKLATNRDYLTDAYNATYGRLTNGPIEEHPYLKLVSDITLDPGSLYMPSNLLKSAYLKGVSTTPKVTTPKSIGLWKKTANFYDRISGKSLKRHEAFSNARSRLLNPQTPEEWRALGKEYPQFKYLPLGKTIEKRMETQYADEAFDTMDWDPVEYAMKELHLPYNYKKAEKIRYSNIIFSKNPERVDKALKNVKESITEMPTIEGNNMIFPVKNSILDDAYIKAQLNLNYVNPKTGKLETIPSPHTGNKIIVNLDKLAKKKDGLFEGHPLPLNDAIYLNSKSISSTDPYVHLPQEAKDAIQHYITASEKIIPTSLSAEEKKLIKPFGSSVTTVRGELPHISDDVDWIMPESLYNKHFKGKVPLYGTQKTTYGYTHAYKLPNNLKDEPLDINVIRQGKDGKATGQLAEQLFLKEFPEEFYEAKRVATLEGKSFTINKTPEELAEKFDSVEDTILDSFIANKSKHYGRSFIYLEQGSPEIIERVLHRKGKILFGNTYEPLTKTIDYSNSADNLRLLQDLRYKGINNEAIAKDPKRMALIMEDYYQNLSGVTRGVEKSSDVISSLTQWQNKIRGGINSGTGLNTVGLQNSGYGDIIGQYQVPLNQFIEGKTPLQVKQYIDMLHLQLEKPFDDRTITILDPVLKKHNLGRASSIEELNTTLNIAYKYLAPEKFDVLVKDLSGTIPYLKSSGYNSRFRGVFTGPKNTEFPILFQSTDDATNLMNINESTLSRFHEIQRGVKSDKEAIGDFISNIKALNKQTSSMEQKVKDLRHRSTADYYKQTSYTLPKQWENLEAMQKRARVYQNFINYGKSVRKENFDRLRESLIIALITSATVGTIAGVGLVASKLSEKGIKAKLQNRQDKVKK